MGLVKKSKESADLNNCDVVYNDCTNKIGSCAIVTYTNDMKIEEAKKVDNSKKEKDECNCSNNDELFADVLKLILVKLDGIESAIREIKEG